MEKINIAEILKSCPKGMELDCTMFDNVTFVGVDIRREEFPIEIKVGIVTKYLTKEGCYHRLDFNPSAKCVIFPKGKTTWEGFVPPCPFKDGDIVFTHANCLKVGLGNTWISIFQEKRNGGVATYVDYAEDGDGFYSYNEDKALLCMEEDIMRQRFATEEEKAKLFQAIKDNGYKWNEETKTLDELIEPKFKVGDRITSKVLISGINTITKICEDHYELDDWCTLKIDYQDKWELVSNKFDISTLVPFESKVLVRNDESQYWIPAFWGYKRDDGYTTTFGWSKYCVPFDGNEHLLGTTDDCEEFYKTWK